MVSSSSGFGHGLRSTYGQAPGHATSQTDAISVIRSGRTSKSAIGKSLAGDRRVDLTELALDLGFSSYSHFSGAFKHSHRQTPFQLQHGARVR
jgi:AraC-like DNA-binding protein